MSVFIRRFTFDPGTDVLLNIESVNILDLEPPSPIKGIGTGATLIVGEFENGPFSTQSGGVFEVTSATDLATTFGTLGFQYGSVPANNPCARQRSADGALFPEFWNGNGFVQLQGKQYARLFICRVDTSVGAVQFTRLAFLTGLASFRYALASGQVLQVDSGSGPQSATFTGTAASVNSGAGTYPTTFTGGQTLVLGVDGQPNFTVTFLAADQSQAQVIARINQYAGFPMAASVSGTVISLTGLVAGLAGQVRVVSGSAGVLTTLGLTAATTLGGGNVQNIAAVAPTEVATIVQAAVSNSKVEVDSAGRLRLSNTGASGFLAVGSGTTAANLGFAPGALATSNGQAILISGPGTYPWAPSGGETLVLQIGSKPQVTTTFANTDTTLANVLTKINAAFTAAGQGAPAVADGATRFYIQGLGTGPTDSVSVVSASGGIGGPAILTALGLTVGTVFGTATARGSIPAGTVVQVPNGQAYVTMQDIDFVGPAVFTGAPSIAQGGVLQPLAGPYSVKVRPALDDGTGVSAIAGAVTQVTNPPDLGAFSVVNLTPISAALTETQLDVAYQSAMTATLNPSTVAKQTNIMFSARQSNSVRKNLRATALSASSNGLFGRVACIRPPLNTPESVALSTTAEPGVGAYRSDRVIYCYIGSNVTVPIIASVGSAGGAGFTPDGAVDVGSDSLLASFMSQLPPEENPGQETPFAGAINGLESGANVQNFTIADYELFKAAGIAALRMDDGTAIFQSGVTSVDPNVNPGLVTIARRRMADYIQDSLALRAKTFGKKLATVARRKALVSEIRQFLDGLLGKDNPNNQRIDSYALSDKQNSATTLGQGLYRVVIAVRTLSSLDSIVLATTIGPTVTNVVELANAA